MAFNGFISYSHAADGRLAPAVQRGLHRLAKPWHRRRALWIFRDQTGLAVTPGLWSSIQHALDGSEYFVLLASPEAANSPWVNREIEHWVTTRPADRILPVVTDGSWQWDPVCRDFTADSTAVPAALRGAFVEEPLYLDLRWARDDGQLSLRHVRFREAIAQLAAPMHGVSKDELEGEDIRQHRRARQLRSGALAVLAVLLVVASLTGGMAVRNAARADASAAEALRQQRSASQQRDSAQRFADEARRQQGLATQQQARAKAAAAETTRQQGLAAEQRGFAQRAAAEAQRQGQLAAEQRAFARRAAAEADRQEQLAREQTVVAQGASAEAASQQRNARVQRDLADQAAARAQEQERLAKAQQALARQWATQAAQQTLVAQERQRQAQEATREAGRQQANADEQRRFAVGRRLVNEAKAMIDEDPRTAVMLGTAAETIQADAEVRRQLAGLVTSTRYAGTLPGVDAVTYGPGSVVAARNGDGAFALWDVADRARPVRLAAVGDDALPDRRAVFSPDGRTLVVDGLDKTAILWDVADPVRPVRIGRLPGPTSVSVMAFSPDGRTLAAPGRRTDPAADRSDVRDVVLWDVADPARPRRLSALPGARAADGVAFSPDGRSVVVNAEATDVWDVSDRTHPRLLAKLDLEEHQEEGHQLMAVSRRRPLLAVCERESGTVLLVDITDPARPQRRATLTSPDWVTSLAFNPAGDVLAAGDGLGAVTLWGVAEPSQPARLDGLAGNGGAVTAVTYSPDGRTLTSSNDTSTTLWNTADHGAPEAVAELPGRRGSTRAATFAAGGRSMALAHSDGTTVIWDVTRPARPVRRATLRAGSGDITAAAFSSDGHTLAVLGEEPVVSLIDVTDPKKSVTFASIRIRTPRSAGGGTPPAAGQTLNTLAFSADGRLLCVGTYNGSVMLWDLSDRTQPRAVGGMKNTSLESVAFSPDARTMATSDYDGKVLLFDMTDPDHLVQLATLGSSRQVSYPSAIPVTFSPDGRTLVAAGGSPQTATLWDVTDRSHPTRITTLTGHRGSVQMAAFDPDGRTLTTGSTDGTVLMWDIAAGAEPLRIATIKRRNIEENLTLGSPDGHTLATVAVHAADRAATLWDYSRLNALRADPTRQACAISGRGLTAAEWARFIPELPYRPTCRR